MLVESVTRKVRSDEMLDFRLEGGVNDSGLKSCRGRIECFYDNIMLFEEIY